VKYLQSRDSNPGIPAVFANQDVTKLEYGGEMVKIPRRATFPANGAARREHSANAGFDFRYYGYLFIVVAW